MRFTVTAGSEGYAFLAVMPCIANDRQFVIHSNAAFAGTSTIGTLTTTAGVTALPMSGLPYGAVSLSDFSDSGNPACSGRAVSVGVSVQYTGTVLNRGGVMRSYTDPNHSNLFGQDFAQTTAPGVAVQTVTEQKRKYTISAIDTAEWEYHNGETNVADTAFYPYSQGRTLNNTNLALGGAPFFWDCVTTPGNTFSIEIKMHAEYIGRLASSNLSPSSVDTAGFEKVAAASAKVNALRAGNPEIATSSLFASALKDVMNELKPAAVSGLKSMAGNVIRSYL